jgi:hypothetical protein
MLHCHRYIELNPVRARMTDDPTAYPWSSSCASHGGLRQEAILSPHPEYTTLAATLEARRAAAYRNPNRRRPESHPNPPAATTRLGSQRLPCDGRSQDSRLRRHQARAPLPAPPKLKRL